MEKTIKFIKKNAIPISLIILGCLIFYWVKDYKEVPSGIGPAFFPKVVASLMIGLSIICIFTHLNKEEKGEFVEKRSSVWKIAYTAILLIMCTLLMEHVHVMLGVVLFLIGFLKVLAQLNWLKTLLISLIGSGVLYLAIMALQISM